MADWSELPHDIIEMIGARIDAVEDFLAFSAVCRSWRSFYLNKKWTPGPDQMPWLMLSDDRNSNKRGFFSLYRDKVYDMELPEASGRRCWGSSDGWLVTIGSDLEIHLLNAFTRDRIQLPAGNTFQILFNVGIEWYQLIDKAIVVKHPTQSESDEFLVMAIFGPFKQLAFTKTGYSSWRNVEESFNHRFLDVVATVNDKIFAISASGILLLVDMDDSGNGELQEVGAQNARPPHRWAVERTYLVESEGELLMVYQNLYIGHMTRPVEPIQFEVLRFDFGGGVWVELNELGDRALFVGDNISVSVSTRSKGGMKCRGKNRIYFIGSKVENWWRFDEYSVDRDSGVYNLGEGIVEPFYFGADYPCYYSCPIWLAPIVVYAPPL